MTSQQLDILDLIEELTQPITHHEHYGITVFHQNGTSTWQARNHTTSHPPLITQLWEATHTGSAQGNEGARPGYTSKPTARIDAIDIAARIDLAAARWVRDLGHDDPLDTIGCIQRLGSLIPNTEPATTRQIIGDVRRWWTWCRILTGWDTPAWRPDNTCPLCAKRGTLRIKLADHTAMCIDCEETWQPETIGILADHIRTENQEDDDTPEQAAC